MIYLKDNMGQLSLCPLCCAVEFLFSLVDNLEVPIHVKKYIQTEGQSV